MDIEKVIERLLNASYPERRLDGDIAEAIGWTRRTERLKGPDGLTSVETKWYPPNSQEFGRVPAYTNNLEAAYTLFQDLCPDKHAGVTWGEGFGSAGVLNGATIARAATPALALCALALKESLQSKEV